MSWSQQVDFPLGHLFYEELAYYRTRQGVDFFSKFKPIGRHYMQQQTVDLPYDSRAFNWNYLREDAREWTLDTTKSENSFWNLYTYPADLIQADGEGLDLHVNPVLHFQLGQDSRSDEWLFQNTRGLELRGTIDERIGFYTQLAENQIRYPRYVNDVIDSLGTVPQEGFWKRTGAGSADFFRAQGYIDFGITQHISAQFGYGRHFIGDGQRSLILSDVSNNYPYLRLTTDVWKVKYTNLFAQLTADVLGGPNGTFGNQRFPRKYLALHHLDIRARDNLHIGLFEAIVYGEPDSLDSGIKLEYLNPVIFYRALEQQDGSPDNVIIGLDFNWQLGNRVDIYGQLIIDEMRVKDVFSGSGWWGNKQGVQLGAQLYDAFGINHLDVQLEWNGVRPYTYAHEDGFTNYTHYQQALAHPLGANFQEVLGRIRFQPWNRFWVRLTGLRALYGNDIGGVNYGRDIFRDYRDRSLGDFGNDWLQGERTELYMAHLRATFHLRHNLFIDGDFLMRKESGSVDTQSTIFGCSIRLNFPERYYFF